MEIDPFWLVAAAAGGFFGAAIGALQAFIFCGLTVLLGVVGIFGNASAMFISYVPFGPVFGPHIAFAGGVAAVAYARKRGLADGKDIVTPLITLRQPTVLLVGAAFGMVGYVIHAAIAAIPWFGGHTDSVALTVVVSALIVRFAFGSSGLAGRLPHVSNQSTELIAAGSSGGAHLAPPDETPGRSSPDRLTGWARFAPTESNNWIRYQEGFYHNSLLGLFAGGMSAGIAVMIVQNIPSAAGVAAIVGFGLSAFSLLFLVLGMSIPVTHHMTLIGGVAAVTFLPIVGGNMLGALIIGAVFGMVAAWGAELFSRLWHIRGDSHIDPPASSIWLMTLLVLGLAAVLS
ncbi:MAG TPA: hypothetical protein VIU87_23035 [Mycobacterium sp.]